MEYDKDILKAGLNQTLKIAQERTRTLDNLRSALLENNDESIRFYAAKLCGLNQTELNQIERTKTQIKKAHGKKTQANKKEAICKKGGKVHESGGISESINARTR